MYEFAIAVGLKQRRLTALHAAWLGGVVPALTKTQSLMSGRGPPVFAEALCAVPGPTAAAPMSIARTLIATTRLI